MTAPSIVFGLLLALVVALQILAWKKNDKLFWVGTFFFEVAGNFTFLLYTAHFYKLRLEMELGTLELANPPAYGTFSFITLFFALVFLTAILISIVLAFGKRAINREEGVHIY